MVTEHLKRLVEDIDTVINADSLARREREDRLWEASQLFWKTAFPTGISTEDRQSIWAAVVKDCDLETRRNGSKILDVLEWPATGASPTWI